MCRHYTPKDVSSSIRDVEDAADDEPADDESVEAPEEEPEPTVADD